MDTAVSNIEVFPNELFVELFEYFSPADLYNIFFNLNSRFNSIIHSLRNLHYVLQEDWDDRQRTIPIFARQVSTLIIQHDESIDFSSYPNIRSLKLSMPTAEQCNAIQPSLLPNLEHLSITNFFFSDSSEQLCTLIFSDSFSRLKTFRIDRMTFHASTQSLSLRELTISPCTWKSNMYEQIFHSCPKLTHLRIQRLQNLSFQLPSKIVPAHPSLRHLTVHFSSIGEQWYNQIKNLLTVVPNLETLTLRIDQNETSAEFPFDLFARLLTDHVPHLIELRAKIPFNRFLSKDLHAIKRCHPLFSHTQYRRSTNPSVKNYLLLSSKQTFFSAF